MPDRPTEADLARWEALAAKATPGPWRVGHPWSAEEYWHYLCSEASKAYIIGPYDVDEGGIASTPDDAAFLAASRTAVPALVAEVRRLRQVLEIAALACEDHGARALARAIREAEREHVLRPEEGSGDA